MEKLCGYDQQGDQMDMPPGFRFHPTDEELITHYLSNKAVDNNFVTKAIGEVDMNKTEPWELPRLAKLGGKELYFFCVRDKKYPTGLRTNRATAAGYWKATGKDKEIFKGRSQLLIGMKKTLVFYTGRAPKGEKTNWVIHEFRLEGKFPMSTLPKSAKVVSEWVICRVFYKTSGGKKLHISGPMRPDSGGAGPSLPPLMDSPTTYSGKIINSNIPELIRVPCFSNTIDTPTTQKNIINNFLNSPIFDFESNSNMLSELQSNPLMHHFSSGSSLQVRDQGILMGEMVTVSQDTMVVSSQKNTRKFEDQGTPSTSTGPIDLDCIWNY